MILVNGTNYYHWFCVPLENQAMKLWCSVLFFLNDTATTEIYTLSLHDALPIWSSHWMALASIVYLVERECAARRGGERSEEHTSELQSHSDLVCRLLLEKKKKKKNTKTKHKRKNKKRKTNP